MDRLRMWLENPRRRRELLTASSGLLIVAALAADYLLSLPGWSHGLMAAAAVVAGSDIAVRAWHSLRNRHASIELLVTIATAGALVIGEYWEAAAVTFLFRFGAYLEARTLSHTRRVLQELLDLAPATAIVLRDGEQVEVGAHAVAVGETVLIKPGARVAVDGEVLDGRSAVDESSITGEPMPAEKVAGSAVFAGTVNQDGLLKVRAGGVGADTTLVRIVRRVEEAQEAKAPTQRFIERFARWYTPAIIALSALAFAITRDIEPALTLLVIGCPGALVISTPISVVAGIGRSARRGILIKGGEFLENAGKISVVALDKTGTLTEGRPRVTDVVPLAPALAPVASAAPSAVRAAAGAGSALAGGHGGNSHGANGHGANGRGTNGHGSNGRAAAEGAAPAPWTAEQAEVLRWAAIAEAGSEHPLARSILAAARPLGPLPEAEEFATFTGRGVRARIDGRTVGVGTPELMAELGIAVDAAAEAQLGRLAAAGKTAVLVARDGALLGALGIADTLRPSARELVRALEAAGVQPIMLTGDDRATAEAIAAEAGVRQVYAELLPEDKLEQVRRLQAEGHVVAMVGDGINDAPALAAADIGMAMGAAGTGIAIETADIALLADDLLKIPEAVRLSKATLGNIRQNVVIALITVAALLGGVLLGEVGMAGGMLIHEASVLVVILNGMRLLRA